MKRNPMKRILMFLLPFCLISSLGAVSQSLIDNVIVETYYISDANDQTDLDGGPALPAGTVTYRVFLDLTEGSKLQSIYGDELRALKVESTLPFFNNEDRGQTYGHQIQNTRIDENTVALDSWFSFGAATDANYGVLKAEDTNGSIIGGANNDGGSSNVPGGLLVNDDPTAGIPLTQQDGLIPGMNLTPQNFVVAGIQPETVFGAQTVSGSFVSNNTIMGTGTGVSGATSENKILIGQFTTLGEFSFELNIQVASSNGDIFKYVSDDENLQPGEVSSSLLKYPPQCGCTDPDYLEWSPAAACDDGSCTTLITFGCTDALACNFDPNANFSIPMLCCYGPEDCNGLDVSIVCPTLSAENPVENDLRFYPNPTLGEVNVQFDKSYSGQVVLSVFDISGKVHLVKNISAPTSGSLVSVDLSALQSGIYILHLSGESLLKVQTIIKE